jgi:hypothetical protein
MTTTPVQTKPSEQTLQVTSAEEHFRLYFFSVIARLLVQLDANRQTFTNVLERLPFLDVYQSLMAGYAPTDLPFAAYPRWWDDQIAAFERHTPEHLPLRALIQAAGLTAADVRILIAVGLVEEDVRFGTLFAQLQDPLTTRRPCAGLLTWLLSPLGVAPPSIWASLHTLIDAALLVVENPNDIRPEWILRIPSHIWDAITAQSTAQPAVGVAWQGRETFPALDDLILPDALHRQVHALPGLIQSGQISALMLRGMTGSGRRTLLGSVAQAIRRDLIVCSSGYDQNRQLIAPLATLLNALPMIRCDPAPGETIELAPLPGYAGAIGVTIGREGGLRGEQFARALTLTLPLPDPDSRRRFWQLSADPAALDSITQRFLLTGGFIQRAAQSAAAFAAVDGRDHYTIGDVQQAARVLNRQVLETLATPLPAVAGWSALVVSQVTMDDLRLLELRCRQREPLIAQSGAAFRQTLTRGVRALFTGPSGTGKTLASRALAGALQMDVYRVDLAAVVNKYIGETERNLNQVFSRAEELDVILLLDEGDSLMTQRTDVRNSNDRYANLETNYLLQRLENYEGIVVVTTNAGQRIDSAFLRRFDLVIDFSAPDEAERLRLWAHHLPAAHELDVEFLGLVAASCILTGGQIRGAALTATLLSLEDRAPVTARHLEAALRREYRKSGGVYPLLGVAGF